MSVVEKRVESGILTWSAPTGFAADKSNNIIQRMQYYRFSVKHCLKDGTRVMPTIPTLKLIMQAWDEFGLEVAIDVDSYIVRS